MKFIRAAVTVAGQRVKVVTIPFPGFLSFELGIPGLGPLAIEVRLERAPGEVPFRHLPGGLMVPVSGEVEVPLPPGEPAAPPREAAPPAAAAPPEGPGAA